MSVVIRGMKMPKDCTECRFAFDGRCFANWGRKSKIDVTNYCPLIELHAEHGRLIDVDELAKEIQSLQKYRFSIEDPEIFVSRKAVMQAISDNPTVIEAEGVSE